MKTAMVGVVLISGALLAGCTFPSSGRVVSRNQAGQMRRLDYGTVEKISPVVVEGQRGQIGLYGGGAAGVASGGAVGHGVGTDLAQVGGGIVGAVAGQAVEEAVTRKDAREMFIKLDNGSMVVVTQIGSPTFGVGERVAVANGPGGAQVLIP
jgi:outer membrane lipoprotein SlyB